MRYSCLVNLSTFCGSLGLRGWEKYISAHTVPKEQFHYHQAELDGSGGSSYINAVVLRQEEDYSSWANLADRVLEQCYYYIQSRRVVVSAIINESGMMTEWIETFGIYLSL